MKEVSYYNKMSLESKLKDVKGNWLEITVKLSENQIYKYLVDVGSGEFYYTIAYGIQEMAAGKDVDTVIKTRLLAMAVHAFTMRPIGVLRNYVAKKWGVTQKSSIVDKIKVNLVSVTPVHSVVYGCTLVGGMFWSGHWDWESSAYAWAIGVGLGALHSIPFGFVQDKIRSFFGVQPAIVKSNDGPSEQRNIYISTKTNPS